MKINLRTCTEEELWKYVATNLARSGVDVMLVGGAVVSVYTKGAYQSGDLDFVYFEFTRKELDRVLIDELGFKKKGRHYKHDECDHLFLEFMSFPASIGEDYNIKPDEVEVEGQVIKIYSPTDCVRDRLASYIHFDARECLDQAVMVAKKHTVNLSKIKKWCLSEKGQSQWGEFEKELEKK